MSLPTDFGPDSGGRMKVIHVKFLSGCFNNVLQGICIIKPIVYGNVARYFGKKREEDGHTHQWTVYVKPYNNEDMSVYVKKVHFKLHESYANQNRIVVKPPYEIRETGWGEFEIVIKIHFHDPNERPVITFNTLCLSHHEKLLFISGYNVSYIEIISFGEHNRCGYGTRKRISFRKL